MTESKKNTELMVAGFAFSFFLFITCCKLTNASLWFDEAIEYWYSKIMFGRLPYPSQYGDSVNMYQRIISTFQPPLYNVIMHFWLKVSDNEWWFRFFGVVTGFVGMVGIYKTVKKISNAYAAALAVIFSSTVYQLYYYWQECAEYCLMLCTLCWAVYFWVCLFREANTRNIILFVVFCVLSVYSQYGAVFPVSAMLLTAFVSVMMQKNRKNIITLCISYISAFVFAALPLLFFFLNRQLINMSGDTVKGSVNLSNITFSGGPVRDFAVGLFTVFQWNLFPQYSDAAVMIILVVVSLLLAAALIIGKSKLTWWMFLFNVIGYVLYYISVKTTLYSYGVFGDRYNLFFIPSWIVLFFAGGIDIYNVLKEKTEKESLFLGICICAIFCYGMNSWTGELSNDRDKNDGEDIRGAVTAWYEQHPYEKDTIIYYAADSAFAYYVRQNEYYTEHVEDNVVYMPWLRDKSSDEYTDYIYEIYGDHRPEDIYLVASHLRDDVNVFIQCFTDDGYTAEELFTAENAFLIHLAKYS